MHKDDGKKSTKTIFHPGVASIPDTHPSKCGSHPLPRAGDRGLFELKLCTGVTGSVKALRPGLVRCLARTYGDLGDLAERCSPDRAVSPGIDISEELSGAGRS